MSDTQVHEFLAGLAVGELLVFARLSHGVPPWRLTRCSSGGHWWFRGEKDDSVPDSLAEAISLGLEISGLTLEPLGYSKVDAPAVIEVVYDCAGWFTKPDPRDAERAKQVILKSPAGNRTARYLLLDNPRLDGVSNNFGLLYRVAKSS